MACRKVVCQECATEWDGINYCVACLAARRGAARGGSPFVAWSMLAVASAALAWLSVRLMVWAGVFVTSLL